MHAKREIRYLTLSKMKGNRKGRADKRLAQKKMCITASLSHTSHRNNKLNGL